MVSVQDIWLGSTSVEDVDALTKVLGGLSPCDYIGGAVGLHSKRSIGR